MKNEENNKLIAQFMGVKTLPKKYLMGSASNGIALSHLGYDEYWDKLMPVVEKCLETHNSLIDGREIINTPYDSIIEGLKNVSLKEIHKAAIEFIKWYNAQPNPR